ncbi:13307_t:CDS:2, partial [Ambispora leptoticha]
QSVIEEAIRVSLNKLRSYYARSDSPMYAVTTLLDPRLKKAYYEKNKWDKVWIDWAIVCLNEVYDSYDDIVVPNTDTSSDTSLGRVFKNLHSENEIDFYLNSSVEHDTFPKLTIMARDYLAIPASSASSERLFSRGSNMDTKKRGSLNPETIQKAIALCDWID